MLRSKDPKTNEEWAIVLKSELDLGRPLYYSGSDDGGAGVHAFNCDGYDENDYFHFNWGWGGRDDAFYAIGALNTTKYAFNGYNETILGCYPVSEDYFSHPERVTGLTLTENTSHNGVVVSWVNPTHDMQGQALTNIDTVFVCRNFQTETSLAGTQIGVTMSYRDIAPESRIYLYSMYVKTVSGQAFPFTNPFLLVKNATLSFS